MIKRFWPYFLILAIVCFFFYPIFLGKIPFPADLLVGEYSPYNSNSYFGIAPGGVPNKAQGFDVIRMIFPWKEFAVNSLASGSFPLWNPYNFSGVPFMANFQSGVFYPLNFIFLIFGNIYGWSVYVVLQPILAAFFAFLFLRENNLSKQSSLFGAITFALSSFMVVWVEYGNLGHAILWLPLILLLIDRNLKKTTYLTSLFLVCALTMSILAGYIQLTIYLFIFVISYLIFKAILQKKIKKIAIFIPIFALPLFLTSVQLLSTYEVFSESARTAYSREVITKLLIPVWHIATTFVPDFFGNPATRNYWVDGTYIERVTYVGVLPLIFTLVALFKKKKGFFWFFFGWAVFIYLLLLATPFGIFLNSQNVPFIGTGVPTRMMFLYFFSISVVAAIGLDIWLKEKPSINRPLIILTAVYLVFWIFVLIAPRFLDYSWVSNLSITKKNLIIPSSLLFLSFMVLIFLKKSGKVFTIILVILVLDLLYFFNKITPFSPPEFFYPKTSIMTKLKEIQGISRSWGYGAGFLETNFQTHEKTFSPEGYDPLIVKSYIELVTSAKEGRFSKDIPRSDVVIPQGESNPYRDKLIDLLGVRYVVYKDELLKTEMVPNTGKFPADSYQLIWQKYPWQIYENKSALPRYFLSGKYVVAKNKQEFADVFYKKDFDLKTLILANSLPVNLIEDKTSKVNLVNYYPNSSEFITSSKGNQLLFLSDNYFPGWIAYVDGQEAKILKADYSFRALVVPAGNHRVAFRYEPKSIKYGIMLTGLGAFLLFLFLIYVKKYQK